MSYIDDLCNALVVTLTRAADGPPERFAGYGANREFWVAEAAHCLDVINGYHARFERMKEGSQASHPPKYDWPTIPISEPSMTSGDLSKARSRVREAAQRFLGRCLKMFPVERAGIIQDARRLDVSLA